MRIMSFNLLCAGIGKRSWIKRIPLAVRTIRNCNPDSFGVQEAHIGWMTALKSSFPDYSYVGVGRDNGKRRGEFSAVFYKKDMFEAIDKGSFWLSETPDKPSLGWDGACIRICSWALLRRKSDGKEFVHFNTHLDHRGAVAMQKGAELIAERCEKLFPGIPAFLTGDFNVTPDSVPCKAVLDGGFADCRDTAEKTDKGITYHDFDCENNNHQSVIDYIFTKGDIKVKEFSVIRDRIDGELPSDHYPVTAEVDF